MKTNFNKRNTEEPRWKFNQPGVVYSALSSLATCPFNFWHVETRFLYIQHQLSSSVTFRTRKAVERQQQFPQMPDFWTSTAISRLQKECFWRDQPGAVWSRQKHPFWSCEKPCGFVELLSLKGRNFLLLKACSRLSDGMKANGKNETREI